MTDKDFPAFPRQHDKEGHNGMTLRDYFAAKAMHQFLAGSILPVGFDATEQLLIAAGRAYEVADALLKVREQ